MNDEEDDLDEDDADLYRKNLFVEFYLRHREDPVMCLVEFKAPSNFIEMVTSSGQDPKESLMVNATINLLEEIDSRTGRRFILADPKGSRRIIMIDEIQAISLLAPDEL